MGSRWSEGPKGQKGHKVWIPAFAGMTKKDKGNPHPQPLSHEGRGGKKGRRDDCIQERDRADLPGDERQPGECAMPGGGVHVVERTAAALRRDGRHGGGDDDAERRRGAESRDTQTE